MNVDEVGMVVAIRYRGKMYDHYGILDGTGGVIHVHKKKGMITVDPVDKVLRGASRISYIDDDFDIRWNQYEHAMSLVGTSHKYRFFTDNCETWVQRIRTGRAFSRQVDVLTGTSALILLSLGVLLGS
jgi:hypothetical protein